MVVKCNQTAHQKETVKLIKDFFESANYDILRHATKWGNSIISRLYGIIGIKFDKPFMAEVFEGSFTTSSLLEKYPINKSQVMYIFTVREEGYSYREEKTYYTARATRVYNSGKVYTDESNGNEKYFDFEQVPTYDNLWEYDTYEQQAIKTLVLVADRENVVEKRYRISVSEKENNLIQYAVNGAIRGYGYGYYKIHRVKWIEREDNTDWIALREGSGKKYEYEDSDYCEHFDKSGYCVEAFRESIISKLSGYSTYLKLKRLAETDYSHELQTRYDEIIVLKNLVGTSIINNTDSETLGVLYGLMDKVIDVITIHENIISKLERSREAYEECKDKTYSYRHLTCYGAVDSVTHGFEKIDHYITEIRTKLFDKILQQDI